MSGREWTVLVLVHLYNTTRSNASEDSTHK